MTPFVRNLLILAAVAALIVVLNQEAAVVTAGRLLNLAFFIVIGVVAYFLWRDFARREIALWPTRQQWVFYSAIGLFVVDVGWFVLARPQARDALAFFLVAGICGYVAVRTWLDQRRVL
jgi:hypothetical protein